MVAHRVSSSFLPFLAIVILFLISGGIVVVATYETSGDDDPAPKSAGCDNNFQLVKLKSWVDGTKQTTLVGLSARFGAILPSRAFEALRISAILINPSDCCANLSSKLSNSIALAKRGNYTFTNKAKIAELGGATGLLVINEDEYLY